MPSSPPTRGPSWYRRPDGISRVDLRWCVPLGIDQLAAAIAVAQRLGALDDSTPAQLRNTVRAVLECHGTSVLVDVEPTDEQRELALRAYGEPAPPARLVRQVPA